MARENAGFPRPASRRKGFIHCWLEYRPFLHEDAPQTYAPGCRHRRIFLQGARSGVSCGAAPISRSYISPRIQLLPVSLCSQGTFTVEVTVDGLFWLHPVGIQHTISPENSWAYNHYFDSTEAAYPPDAINTDKNSVVGDGAPSIQSTLEKRRQAVAYIACMRHWLQHKPTATRTIARELQSVPKVHKAEVCRCHIPATSMPECACLVHRWSQRWLRSVMAFQRCTTPCSASRVLPRSHGLTPTD